MGQEGKRFFFFIAFLCVSEHFESIETHFFFKNFRKRLAQNARKWSEQDVSVDMLHQTVTLATAIFLFSMLVDAYNVQCTQNLMNAMDKI